MKVTTLLKEVKKETSKADQNLVKGKLRSLLTERDRAAAVTKLLDEEYTRLMGMSVTEAAKWLRRK